MQHFQVAIIGGGPGGYETVIRLNQYQIDCVVIEKERLGGICLNWGCIPTKTLVKSAELIYEISHSEVYGLNSVNLDYCYKNLWQRKNSIVEQLINGIEYIFRKRKIPFIHDEVIRISKQNNLYLLDTKSGDEITSEYVIIATGSVSKELPGMIINEDDILSSTGMLNLTELPKRLVIVGGGVIGCEFASIFYTFGVAVTIIEFLPRIVSTEDEEVSKRLAMALKKSGIKILTEVSVKAVQRTAQGLALSLSNDELIETDKILMSVGRTPAFNIECNGFDLIRDKQAIVIDELMQTNTPNIYAIGDVTGKMQLAHTASKQGLMVAEHINHLINKNDFIHHVIDYNNIPRCTFTNPEIGSVGLTESQAREIYNDEIIIGRFPFSASGKALSMSNTFGFVKTIARKCDMRLLGMHIIGPQAAELIAQGSILISMGAVAQDIEKIVFAHPTLSESIMESIEDLRSLSIHKM